MKDIRNYKIQIYYSGFDYIQTYENQFNEHISSWIDVNWL